MNAFLEALPRWADPAGIAALLAPGLAPATAASALEATRLRPQLDAWLDAQFGAIDPAPLDPADAAVLDGLATAENGATKLVALAGAVWHAPAICGSVLATEIATFIERHGAGPRAAAIRHATARPPITATAGLDELATDGGRCVAAWLDTLQAAVAGRVRLGWPHPGLPAPEDAHRAHGPAVIRLLAADLSAA